MKVVNLTTKQLKQIQEISKRFVSCYYNLSLVYKKGIKNKNNVYTFRYYDPAKHLSVYVIIDLKSGKFIVKKGKDGVNIMLDLFGKVDVNKLDKQITNCGFIDILKELESIGLVTIKTTTSKRKVTTTSKRKRIDITKLLKEDVDKVLLPGNKTVLDLYKTNPYFRLILTIPKNDKCVVTLEDDFTINIQPTCIFFNHSANLVKISNVIQGMPELDLDQRYVSIYYEFYTPKVELTKLPVLIFIPVILVNGIYICNTKPTEDDLYKLSQFLNDNINEQSFEFLETSLQVSKCLCVDLLTGTIKFPITEGLNVGFTETK